MMNQIPRILTHSKGISKFLPNTKPASQTFKEILPSSAIDWTVACLARSELKRSSDFPNGYSEIKGLFFCGSRPGVRLNERRQIEVYGR